MIPHLTSSAVLRQGPDHHSALRLVFYQAEAKADMILEGGETKEADDKL